MKKIFGVLFFAVLSNIVHAQTCGSTNIALNKTAFASSEGEWHKKEHAVDGDPSTTWWGPLPSANEFIYIDLGQQYNLCKVVIVWGGDGRASNYTIDVSNDATNWTTIQTVTGNSAVTDVRNVTGTGRYVRIKMTAFYFSWATTYEIYELEVYNTTATNTPPTVSLTAPVNNATFTAGSNITLTATASDADGTVSKVEFYNGATKLGEATSSPYTYTWTNVAAGSYSLTAKATDNGNASTTSSVVNITVSTPSANAWNLSGNAGTTPGTDFIGTTDNQRLVIKTNNNEAVTVLPGGNVGIGTSNPSSQLEVIGAVAAATSNGFIQLWPDNALIWKQANNWGGLRFGSATALGTAGWSEKMRITDAGNLGINTQTPVMKLDINTGNGQDGINLSNTNGFTRFYSSSLNGNDYNPITRQNDAGIIFGTANTSSSFGFVIAPWSNQTGGLRIDNQGRVGIGTSNTNDVNYKLFVETGIRTRKIKVDQASWADYVFDSAYHLPALSEVHQFIKKNKHLPGVPSAAEITKEGLDVGENQAVLLKKIEELTLYIIEMKKDLTEQAEITKKQQCEIDALKKIIRELQ